MFDRGREYCIVSKIYKIIENHTSWVICMTAPAGVLGTKVTTYDKVLI